MGMGTHMCFWAAKKHNLTHIVTLSNVIQENEDLEYLDNKHGKDDLDNTKIPDGSFCECVAPWLPSPDGQQLRHATVLANDVIHIKVEPKCIAGLGPCCFLNRYITKHKKNNLCQSKAHPQLKG